MNVLFVTSIIILDIAFSASIPTIGGCNVFPADSWWNTPIDTLPVHSKSTSWINSIGASTGLKGDFGSGLWDGAKIGIPYDIVPSNQANVPIEYIWYGDESDAGPFPIPLNAKIEGDPNDGDRHILVIQQGTCMLYELYYSYYDNGWTAGSGAKWDLNSNNFRTLGWTSADAAGLPVFPGLVRWEEIVAGEINHAIRFTADNTRNQYIWPATHFASDDSNPDLPPMGARFRLKANFDISSYSGPIKIILTALKKYGLVLADNGSPWYMSGVPNESWDNDMLNEELSTIIGSNLEAVDVSSQMISASSGQVSNSPTTRNPTIAPTTKSPTSLRPTSQRPSQAPVVPTTKQPTTLAPVTTNTKSPTLVPTSKSPTRLPTSTQPTIPPTNAPGSQSTIPQIGGCNIFPADNWWNTPINSLPVHSQSSAWINSIGASTGLKGDFGSGLWDGAKIGIPYDIVPSNQANVPIEYIWYGDESDAGPFPIPRNAKIEGDPNDGDRHILVIQQGTCRLYELYYSYYDNGWTAGSGAKWDLNSNNFRTLGWTSADAAGLPIFPGLVKWEEIVAGEINHAIRFTARYTRNQYIWPATHFASDNSNPNLPPMGARFRLKANFDISGYSAPIKIILTALKKYGLVLADNGSPWYMSGVPNESWDNDMLNEELSTIIGSNLEAVDVSSLMVSPSSGQVKSGSTPATTPRPTFRPTLKPTSKSPTRNPTSKSPTSKSPTRTPTSKSPTTPKPTTKSPTFTNNPTTKVPTARRRRKRGLNRIDE